MLFHLRRAQWAGLLCGALLLCGGTVRAEEPPEADLEFFEKSVRPILVERCLQCHTTDKKPKGGLTLDSRAAVLAGGDSGPALVPRKPEESRLITAIGYEDLDLQMPPKGKLPDEEIAVLTEWVSRGAPWPATKPTEPGGPGGEFNFEERAKHWAFQPLHDAAPPQVERSNWPRTIFDRFILGRLEAEGLTPAAEAAERVWLRRVTFDLTGLPPTPQEISDFLADDSPQAYERVVDRLLSSPHYGERWARHWLDLARFGETAGHEFDFEIPLAYQYRDYVIRAFNADVPFDQFAIEHVAGDLLEQPRRHPTEKFNESIIGTGFWWLGEGKHSPVDIREEEAIRVDNQIDVFTKTFLAMTVSCARCHDHKFDPLRTEDYYALCGYIRSSHYQEAFIDDPTELRAQIRQIRELQDQQLQGLIPLTQTRNRQFAELQAYLRATAQLLPARREQIVLEDAPPETRPEIAFEEFEQETYVGWTVEGTAFGDGPNRQPVPAYQGELNERGKGFINTHSARQGTERIIGDNTTGKLTSPVFKIERRGIRMLIGGGSHVGKTCVNLLIDGKVQRSITGKNSNRMELAEIDVQEFAGSEARLEIVDRETGGWGQIGVDQIVFTDELAGDLTRRRVAAVAQRNNLDAGQLDAWRQLAEQALANPLHLFHAWAVLANAPAEQTPEQFVATRTQLVQRLREQTGAATRDAVILTEFSGDDFGDWIVTGEAFGAGPTNRDDARRSLIQSAAGTLARVPGLAESGRISPRLRGGLRSQTFTIDSDRIWFLLAGHGCQVNLVIDEFHRIRNPIYGGLTLVPDTRDKFQWFNIDVGMWKGHRAYIEILDDGDGWIAADRIAFANAGPPSESPNPLIVELIDDEHLTKPEQVSAIYHVLCQAALGHEAASNSIAVAVAAVPDHVSALFDVQRFVLGDNPSGTIAAALEGSPVAQDLQRLLAKQQELEAALPVPRRAMALMDGTPDDERVFIRGSHKNLGDVVPRRFLEVLGGTEEAATDQGSGRLELAQRMVAPSNPLIARVIVNRVWHHHFGTGIVPTVDDFGKMGQMPSHPDLLDHLALQLQQNGWSLKKLHKLIVLSSTYRMASQTDPTAEEKDPTNKLLHHFPVRRLEAESIRDAVLSVSGRLDKTMHGPGVLPYLTPFMLGRGRPASGPLDGAGRRSIYINVRRNFLTPMFLAFDYPIPFTAIGRRGVSNVPAQALTMMNNPFISDQARLWAEQVLAGPDRTRAERVSGMYVTAFGRPPTEEELKEADDFLTDQGREYGAVDHPQAWADFAHVLFNVKEFIFVN